jgi:uncharacterized protein
VKITNEFTVHTPIQHAWELLTDLPAIAPCMPGAVLTGVEGDTYKGKVKVKVGPVISEFAGTARFVEKSDADYRAAIDAKGRDARSAGQAAAVVTAVLHPAGDDSTTVSVDTDLKITGKLAQFGSGMIKEVSTKLLAQFVANLEAKLAAESAAPPAHAAADSAAPAPAEAAPSLNGTAAPSLNGTAADATFASAAGAGVANTAPATNSTPANGRDSSTAPSAAAVETASETAVAPAPVAPAPVNGAAAAAAIQTPAASPSTTVPARDASPSASPVVAQAEPEPLDLLSVAGSSIYKRLIPVAVGVVAVGAVIAWLVARR